MACRAVRRGDDCCCRRRRFAVLFDYRVLERLIVNVGIVLVFAAFYLRFLKETISNASYARITER